MMIGDPKILSRYFSEIEILYGVHRNSNEYGDTTSIQCTKIRFIHLTHFISIDAINFRIKIIKLDLYSLSGCHLADRMPI